MIQEALVQKKSLTARVQARNPEEARRVAESSNRDYVTVAINKAR